MLLFPVSNCARVIHDADFDSAGDVAARCCCAAAIDCVALRWFPSIMELIFESACVVVVHAAASVQMQMLLLLRFFCNVGAGVLLLMLTC